MALARPGVPDTQLLGSATPTLTRARRDKLTHVGALERAVRHKLLLDRSLTVG